MYTDFKDGPRLEEESITSLIDKYKFLPYTARYWGQHAKRWENKLDAQLAEGNESSARAVVQTPHNPLRESGRRNQTKRVFDIQNLLSAFVEPEQRNAAALSYQISAYSRGRRMKYWKQEEAYSVTPLHMAARFGLCQVLKTLLSSKDGVSVNANQRTKMGTTPIISAASCGHVEAIRILLDHGADLLPQNWYGNALHCAAEAGQCEAIKLLVSYGMDPNIRSPQGYLPLSCCLDNDHVTAFETLLDFGADIHLPTCVPGDATNSIFHDAVEQECVRIVDSILHHRWFDLKSRNDEGKTVIDLAADLYDPTIFTRLLKASAEVNVENEKSVMER
jgi:ankyrin repeat protein